MKESLPFITAWVCVAITGVAAITDLRSAKIPNWLTMPAIAAGPFLWGWYGGWKSLWTTPEFASVLGSVLSALLCGGVMYFALYRKRISGEHAIGAGDIKLFAAIGSLGLIQVGIESMFYAISAGTMFTLARLAWRGVLLQTLANAAFILINPVLPKKRRRELSRENLTKMRFGLSIFVGTLFAVLQNRGNRWF
jgi:prepilin peptidase CpaA